MAEITSELLDSLAPATAERLRDRFLPFFNEALPRYDITTELRVAAFLATVVFESNYLRATKEGRASVGTKARAAQDHYWSTGFYGRGPIQVTHEANYKAFNDFIHKTRPDAPDFVKHPEALEELEWGVEAACWFWDRNKMNPLADKGKFHEIQGLTNRGDASKEAWGYADRFKIYKKCLAQLPDGFTLNGKDSADSSTTATHEGEDSSTASSVTANDPPIVPPTVTVVTAKPYNDVGFKQTIINDAKGILPANVGFQTISDLSQQATGWPPWIASLVTRLALIALVVTAGWILYRLVSYLVYVWRENEKQKLRAVINTDQTRPDIKFVDPPPPEAQKV